MKTIASENQVLMKFYVAVLYKWHPYFPTNINNISDSLKEQIINDSKSVKTLLLSSTASSDLIEFAEYKFGFKISGEDYKERLLNNFLDSYSREIVGIDFRDLQKVENNLVFQKSKETKELGSGSDYFGAVSMDNDQIYMIDASEEIWKIEIYEKLEDEFIEYSVKKSFGLPITQEPILTIQLGPEVDCFNNSKNTELNLFYPGSKLYGEFDDVELADEKYRALCQEITDRKVFYIVQSPNNLSTVNISLTAWNKAEVPHRNKKDWNVTNDHYLGTIDNNSDIFTTKYNNSLVDTASMILLGNQKINISKCPILKETIEKCEIGTKTSHSFRKDLVYNVNEKVTYKGATYISLIDGNIFDNPDISCYWSKIDNDGSILDKLYNNKRYRDILVMSDNGDVYPNGNLSAKIMDNNTHWYKTFTLEEQLGYTFTTLLIDNSYVIGKKDLASYYYETEIGKYIFNLDQEGLKNKNSETKLLPFKQFEFIFEKTNPVINLIFNINEDYYSNGGKKSSYKNVFPAGFSAKLNNKVITSANNGLIFEPNEEYELEIICNEEFYNFPEQQKIFKGVINKNRQDLVFNVIPREYICMFKNHHVHGIVINGDASKVCYYKQTVEIEFSFENDEDTVLNWMMEKYLIINGRPLSSWKNSEYKIRISGGGNVEGNENNNYILTIKNVDQDFNIVFDRGI
jgi:hypothetical protein